jgi:hypothetical protein
LGEGAEKVLPPQVPRKALRMANWAVKVNAAGAQANRTEDWWKEEASAATGGDLRGGYDCCLPNTSGALRAQVNGAPGRNGARARARSRRSGAPTRAPRAAGALPPEEEGAEEPTALSRAT